MRKLYSGGAATRVDADNATLGLRSADAQVAALRAQVDTLLQGTPQDVKAAQGHGRRGARAPAADRRDARRAEIRAPRAARVEALDLRPGDILAPERAPRRRCSSTTSSTCASTCPRRSSATSASGSRCRSPSTRSRTARSRASSSTSTREGEYTPRNLQTADERADQVFATRVRLDEGSDVLRAGMAARRCAVPQVTRRVRRDAPSVVDATSARKFGDFVALDDVSLDGADAGRSTACSARTARASRR